MKDYNCDNDDNMAWAQKWHDRIVVATLLFFAAIPVFLIACLPLYAPH